MLFNSIEFLLFFPIVTLLYFLSPVRLRWLVLLIASCAFYMAFIPVYILILAVTILIDYAAGLLIERSTGHRKRLLLIISVVSTCLVLIIFKYASFFNDSFAAIARFFHLAYPPWVISIILPIGLSFHTFQSLAYVVEVYRGNQRAERHLGLYSLYVMFYPQLVAGPIERPQNLLHQFREEHVFVYQRVTDGLKRMAWGLFKKVVIADRLALLVNQVYGQPTAYDGLALIIATVAFAFQIYCDFSGYSDIAIGAAQVMGFRLMENFDRPYHARSVAEFWKRWHISLSTWFRDYLYISLGGNRVAAWRWQLNLFVTFLISGLWHGARWTFVVWGALNGLYLLVALWTQGLRDTLARGLGLRRHPTLERSLQVLSTFALICFAWIFFRARDLSEAWYIASHLFANLDQVFSAAYLRRTIAGMGLTHAQLAVAGAAILLLEAVHLIQRRRDLWQLLAERPLWFRWSVYWGLSLAILFLGEFGQNQFIYFQF